MSKRVWIGNLGKKDTEYYFWIGDEPPTLYYDTDRKCWNWRDGQRDWDFEIGKLAARQSFEKYMMFPAPGEVMPIQMNAFNYAAGYDDRTILPGNPGGADVWIYDKTDDGK